MNQNKTFWIGDIEINIGIDLTDWTFGWRVRYIQVINALTISILCFYLEVY